MSVVGQIGCVLVFLLWGLAFLAQHFHDAGWDRWAGILFGTGILSLIAAYLYDLARSKRWM